MRKTDNDPSVALFTSERRSDDVANRIMALIYDGQLAPGSMWPAERKLAKHLGLSRPVLGETLKRLEARGLISTRSKSGTYVCSTLPTPLRHGLEELVSEAKWFHDINDLRKGLESYAMPAIIAQQTPERLRELRACLETMRENSALREKAQFDVYSSADLEFHRVLAKMSGNTVCLHLIDFFADLVLKAMHFSERVLSVDYGSVNYEVHRAVFEAIQKRDTKRAIAAIQHHYEFVEQAARPLFDGRSESIRSRR
jgi:GntR family transcriptional repressor for pyruvate dehydrogenase complex